MEKQQFGKVIFVSCVWFKENHKEKNMEES